MKLHFAENISFCDGVDRAFKLVEDLAKDKKKKRMLILGPLVHNDSVAARVKQWGIKKIKTLRSISKDDLVIITAHGAGKDIFDKVIAKGAEVFDSTCPKVIKVQRLAHYYSQKGYQILIYGDKDHKEVKGINGWALKKALIIGKLEELEKLAKKIKLDRPTVLISQTTQNIETFQEIAKTLKKKIKNLEVIDTICRATFDRQKEIKKLAKKFEAVLVIGGKESGNTKRLWQVAKQINKKTYWISDLGPKTKQKLKKDLKGVSKVGIISGASTPKWEIAQISELLTF